MNGKSSVHSKWHEVVVDISAAEITPTVTLPTQHLPDLPEQGTAAATAPPATPSTASPSREANAVDAPPPAAAAALESAVAATPDLPATSGTASSEAAAKPPVYKPPPAPPGKSYLPTFIAPEAYGKKKTSNFTAIVQEVEERMAKVAAKKERDKAAKRRKVTEPQAREHEAVREETGLEFFFTIVIGSLFALFEALDVDVVLGIVLMPVCTHALALHRCVSSCYRMSLSHSSSARLAPFTSAPPSTLHSIAGARRGA